MATKKLTDLPPVSDTGQFLADLAKRHGLRVDYLGAQSTLDIGAISTGAITLDCAIGIGGVPRGRITEIYGAQASGKSTLCTYIAKHALALGNVMYIDVEQTFDRARAIQCGLDVDRVIFVQPDTAEQALDIAIQCAKQGTFSAIILDSIAALNPQASNEGFVGDAHVGLLARLMSNALRMISPHLQRHNTAFILVNQLRQKIGVMYGSSDTTPGGLAMQYYASLRLDCRIDERLKHGEEVYGQIVRVTTVKNKIGPPYRKAYFTILFDDPYEVIAEAQGVLEVAVSLALVERKGGHHRYGTLKLGASGAESANYLRDHPGLLDELRATILTKVHDETIIVTHSPNGTTETSNEG